MPAPAESEVLDILLLKVDQSAAVSAPVTLAVAFGRLKSICEPELVIENPLLPLLFVVVAKVTAGPEVVAKPVPIEVIPEPPEIAPQVIFPDASVVSALEPLHAPKRPSVVVPMLLTLKSVVVAVAVEEAMAKSVVWLPLAPFGVAIESCAYGEVVPIPTEEAKYAFNVVVEPPKIVSPPF